MSPRAAPIPPPRTGDIELDTFARRTADALRPSAAPVVRNEGSQQVNGGWTVTNIAGSGGTRTLAQAEYVGAVLEFTGELSADMSLVMPSSKWLKGFVNSTTGSGALRVKTETQGTGVQVLQTRSVMLGCDGSNVRVIGAHSP